MFLLLCLLARVEELEFAASHARENQLSVRAGLGWVSDCRRPRFSGIIAPGTSCPLGEVEGFQGYQWSSSKFIISCGCIELRTNCWCLTWVS